MESGLHRFSGAELDTYLSRIECSGAVGLNARNLELLHFQHIQNIAFENLDIHLGRTIEIDVPRIFDKIVMRRRGGFCYELNSLFASLLSSLGYEVSVHACRVINSAEAWIPFGHVCLIVKCEGDWLVDVGFGNSFQRPLKIGSGKAQIDEGGTHILEPVEEGWLLRSRIDTDKLEPEYRIDLTPRHFDDFKERCAWTQSSVESGFTHRTFATRPIDGGRMSVLGHELRTYRNGSFTEDKISRAERDRLFVEQFGLPAEDIANLPAGERAPWFIIKEKEET